MTETEAAKKKISSQPREKVAVLLPPSITESFEIVLARASDLVRRGDEVCMLVCNGAVRGCVANPLGIRSLCAHCVRVTETALNEIVPGAESMDIFAPPDAVTSDYDQARDAEPTAEIERSARSTLLTFYRTDIQRPRNALSRRVYNRLRAAYRHYSEENFKALRAILSRGRFDRFEFFNGRIVPTRAAMIAAENLGLHFSAIEVSGALRRLTTFSNVRIHDLKSAHDRVESFIQSGEADLQLGIEFFERRRAGRPTDVRSFTAHQVPATEGKIDDGSKLLVVFTSSEDEMEVAGDQWYTEASQDPVRFIRRLSEILQQRHCSYRILVRMHPNQAGDRTGRTRRMLESLRATSGVSVISPEKRTSSYDLLDRADAVLTFGSTIGLEAAYWGKPSILAGHAAWEKQGIAKLVARPEEAVSALLTTRPTVAAKKNAIAVGAYYMQGTGYEGALTFDSGNQRYKADGRNFLPEKRRHLAYWLGRVLDKSLRKFI